MSDIFQEFVKRRSIRRYTEEPVSEEALRRILAVGLMSASGKSKFPWQFIVVRDRAMLEKLSNCRVGVARMLAKAACAIVVIGDKTITDTVVEDCTIAAINMHLEASSLGREAEDGRSTDAFVRDLLGFPEAYQLQAVLSLGHPLKEARPHDVEKLDWSKVHQETF